MNYKIGDKVIHCRNGVSVIVKEADISGRLYYIVNATRGDQENIYVPVQGCENIIRPVMNEEEANKILNELKPLIFEFNPNTKQRRDAYKKRLSSGKVEDIAYLFRQNTLLKKNIESVKYGPADIDMLNYAGNIFLDELALTYQIDRNKIEEFVINKIEK